MDDDQTDVKPVAGEEASNSEPSTEEPKAAEETDVTVEEPTGDTTKTKVETEESPKKGAQARIRELNAKAKSAEEKAKSLEERVAELTGQVDQQVPPAQYTPQINLEPGADFNPLQYKEDVLKTADAMVTLKVKQSEAIQRINTETSEVMRKYSQLDPDSDAFDKDISDSITEAVEAHIRANPFNASPKKFVDRMMKPYQRAVTKGVGQETANIAKQVAESAIRPTSVSTKGGKSDQEKTIAELEKELGIVVS